MCHSHQQLCSVAATAAAAADISITCASAYLRTHISTYLLHCSVLVVASAYINYLQHQIEIMSSLGSKVGRQYRVWLPWMPMTLVSARNPTSTQPASAVFRTLPRMTKHEIKEYLTKIYGLPVVNVNTMNYEGKRKRLVGRSGVYFYKYKDFKKAIVTFSSALTDVGLGTRIPELEEEERQKQLDADSKSV
jgi:large subunit ribosomal protein L23